LAMGSTSDPFHDPHDPRYGFVLATVFAALLFVGSLFNCLRKPATARLLKLDQSEYAINL
jgi:MFS transporter, FHS family, L-fucose permease